MLVIGNGESRKGIDISKLEGPKVGCNAVYRNFDVDYLVCCDKRMMQEVIHAGVNIKRNTLVYTRPDWFQTFKSLHVRELPRLPYVGDKKWDNPFNWGSGPYAALLGAMYSHERQVQMIGFDLYSNTSCVNNIYKDTPNYSDSTKQAVDPSYWIYQIGKVINCFPETIFTIYQEPNWKLPQAWNYPNVTVDNISNIYYNT